MKTRVMKTETIKSEAEKVINLSDITEGTLVHKLAKAHIKFHGYYACTLDGVKTFIS